MSLEIFIPFWGEPSLLYRAVDSVRAQSNPNWRLHVIDDCYPDLSVGEYFANLDDERVTYSRNEVNVGITANFRECARRSTAEYTTIMGCDDALLPTYVEVILETTERAPFADIIQPGVRVIDADGRQGLPLTDRVKGWLAPRARQGLATLAAEDLATSLIRGDWLYWPSLAFRTETLNRHDFRDEFPVIQDLALLMDMAFAEGTLAYAPRLAFEYRRHAESASQRTLLDGSRFEGERRYYALATALANARGWKSTSRAARRRWISRLHAVALLPLMLSSGTAEGRRSVWRHIFAR